MSLNIILPDKQQSVNDPVKCTKKNTKLIILLSQTDLSQKCLIGSV